MPIALQRITDAAAINSVLTDDWVAKHIRHDAREPGYIEHPALTYYGAYVDGSLVGVFMAIQYSPWEIEVHAALLRPATRYSRDLGRLFLREIFAGPEVLRVTAYVMATLPSAANYCRRLGFKDEGMRRSACKVNGAPIDILVLGLLRNAGALGEVG